ncbi:hypothetical protein CEXT_709161 [Caerostris extrusa]|uniref:Uncharacterized protein n=1 Tax=Caerostris extrusa TaxID=172846 RepID=A0AAV4YC34_CAEEX|nr:hypothetical protein CEXT_709161 [Caerostris extrusa]
MDLFHCTTWNERGKKLALSFLGPTEEFSGLQMGMTLELLMKHRSSSFEPSTLDSTTRGIFLAFRSKGAFCSSSRAGGGLDGGDLTVSRIRIFTRGGNCCSHKLPSAFAKCSEYHPTTTFGEKKNLTIIQVSHFKESVNL